MQHHNGRSGDGREDLEDLVTVCAAVDAVLVLDDRDIADIESGHDSGPASAVVRDQVCSYPRCAVGGTSRGRLGGVQHPRDVGAVSRVAAQGVGECLGERRQAATGGRVGAEESIVGHDDALLGRPERCDARRWRDVCQRHPSWDRGVDGAIRSTPEW